jgi:hypothetical protein
MTALCSPHEHLQSHKAAPPIVFPALESTLQRPQVDPAKSINLGFLLMLNCTLTMIEV